MVDYFSIQYRKLKKVVFNVGDICIFAGALILLAAETGYRIGEILGIDYTKDIDFRNHTIRIYFRDDNENGARAKNAESGGRRSATETFEFLMY